MPDTERKRMRAWTAGGIAVVCITLLLSGFGMVQAIRQTHSLVMLRITDLLPKAQCVRDDLHDQVLPRLETLLDTVAGNLRRPGQADPFRGCALPSWVSEVYQFGAGATEMSLIIWRREADNRWQRRVVQPDQADQFARIIMGHLVSPLLAARLHPGPEPLGFVYDVVQDNGLVIAYVLDPQGPFGRTVVGARVDLQRLREELIEPAVPTDRIAIRSVLPAHAGTLQRASVWAEDFAPLAPSLWLVPQQSFVERQYDVVRRQTLLFVVATFLAMAALLAVMWAMWRVFNREVALSRLKQAFVADVSHELKTPLALICLFGETLLSGRVATEEKRREYYQIITRESTRLTQLINSILDLARIDADTKRYNMRRTDVGTLVRETYETYQLQLDHEGFEHQLVVAENVPEVFCDPAAIAQALINLITNAMKYTDPEEKSVGIDVSRETRRGRHGALISVSDRGIGIRPEDRNFLFRGFYRADDDRVRRRRGAGLGLALVQHVVDAHGGIVDVESRLVKGSTFRIFLPACDERTPAEDENDGENPGS